MNDCVFCKIVKGEIPSTKVYSDDLVDCFMDIMPISEGHTLVISKSHFETLINTPEDVLCRMATVAAKVARAILAATGAEGFNLVQNNKRCAGQVIPHVHIHVIPRKEGDGIKFGWPAKKAAENELVKVADAIKQHLK